MVRSAERGIRTWLARALELPRNVWQAILGMWKDQAATFGEQETFSAIRIDRRELQRIERLLQAGLPADGMGQHPEDGASADDEAIVRRIEERTRRANRNNVTRTAAYWSVYRGFPELHWALLAHLVSRNGGWNMTDLQGELLPRLLTRATRERLFAMLEDANAFIFGDAYPQLLLYEASVRGARPLFHLLSRFHVSAFMRPFWERFWETREPAMLTMALIVNEQHYIESRIVRDPDVQSHVLNTVPFQAQSALQLNQVVLPYGERNDAGRRRLAGLVLENFGNLNERIEVGKKLYAMLFGIPAVANGAQAFASAVPHTGSRADMWPELFTPVRESFASAAYTERLDGECLKPGAERFYSPRLAEAWKDVPLREPERYDWLRGAERACKYIADVRPPFPFDMSAEYCYGLNKVELAVLAKAALL